MQYSVVLVFKKRFLFHVHESPSYLLTTIVFRNGKTTNLDGRVAAELLVSTVEVGQLIVRSQTNKIHGSDANVDVLFCLSHLRLKLAAVLGPLLLAHMFHLQPSHFEVEGVLALQHVGFSDWSCHNYAH